MRTVIILGDRGFLGTYLTTELLKRNFEVVGIDDELSYGSVDKPYDNDTHYIKIRDDVATSNLIPLLRVTHPVAIINLAALVGGISYFHKKPYTVLAHNSQVVHNVFEKLVEFVAVTQLPTWILQASSSVVYEQATVFPTPETLVDDRKILPPKSSYGLQKLAAEYYCQSAHEQYGIDYTIFRPFNVFGVGDRDPDDKLNHVIPDLIRKIMIEGQNPVDVYGDGNQIRTYTYGGDVAKALADIVEKRLFVNTSVNISSRNNTYSVRELVTLIGKHFGKDLDINPSDPFKWDVSKRIPSVSRLQEGLGWIPKTLIESKLNDIYEELI
mgnify:CR=1 FL=1